MVSGMPSKNISASFIPKTVSYMRYLPETDYGRTKWKGVGSIETKRQYLAHLMFFLGQPELHL